jgi:hypothetical protein
MEYNAAITQLSRNKAAFVSLLFNLPEAEYLWRPAPDKWNLLELVCHLRDEEVDDFRARVKICLEQPETVPPTIDPAAWVEERGYANEPYLKTMANFLEERTASVEWLQSLEEPNWDSGFEHPELGRLSAGVLLRNWLMHDFLHLQQAMRIRTAYFQAHSPDPLSYAAGE